MEFFLRKSVVQVFTLPLWGQVSSQDVPKWLVERIQKRDLEINNLGGFTMRTPFGVQTCIAGDLVILYPDSSIGFEKPESFKRNFEPITREQIAA